MFSKNYIMSTVQLLEATDTNKKELSKLKDDVKNKKVDGSLIKKTIIKIYQSDADSLANELPSVGDIVRITILVGIPAAINPVLGIFTLIADKTIKDAINSKVINRYIKNYEKQIEKAEKKIEECEDPKRKIYMKEHLSDLKTGLRNLESKKYDLEDNDKAYAYNSLKAMNDKMELNDSVNLLEYELSLLTEEQELILFDDTKYNYLSEAFDKTKQNMKNTKYEVDRKTEKMDRWFDNMAKDIRHGFTNNARDDIIEDNFPKISKMVKRAIILGFTWAVNPAIAVIGAMTAWALSKKGKETQRKRILKDLNNELEMIEEKLKDADANSDKKKKYELMRLKQAVQNNRDKIKRTVVL